MHYSLELKMQQCLVLLLNPKNKLILICAFYHLKKGHCDLMSSFWIHEGMFLHLCDFLLSSLQKPF